LAQLRLEGWLDEHGGLGPLEHAVRSAVRNGMPPARAAELHRFVADVLGTEATLARGASYGHALLAHHLAEGGRELEAADALLNAAQAATDAGFARMAVRLAALALKLDGSAETRQRARRVAGTIDSLPPPPNALPTGVSSSPPGAPDRASSGPASDPKAMAGMAIQSAISAIIRGELDAAEGLIDTAIAAGFGRAGAQRLWSVAQLKRGNVPEAVRSLKHAHVPAGSPGTRSREAIAAALILLQSGESLEAVRAALEALAGARRAHDARGERVALYVLSGCYQALGREADADKIANAAAAARP
jgi:tetratricopeptide (TPR) repeat protein